MSTNGSIINSTVLVTESGLLSQQNAESIITLDISLVGALFSSGGLLLACLSILFNFYVLKSLVAVKTESLKSKWFIFNLLGADLVLPLFATSDILWMVVYAYGERSFNVNMCIMLAHTTYTVIGLYYQCLASLIMALDRLYAIVAPLKYYTVGYPRWVVWAIIISNWVIPLLLILPAFIVPFMGSLRFSRPGMCYALRKGHLAWTYNVRTFTLVTIGLVTFAIYIILFILVKWMRGRNVAVTEASSSNRKTTISLAVTYFIVHSTSLAVYLPSPIFSRLSEQWLNSLGIGMATQKIIRRILALLYIMNPVVDPMIISQRIPVVKHSLKRILGYSKTTQHRGESIEPQTHEESVDKS